MPHHVSKAKFAELVERAAASLPKQFADALNEVPIEIRDRPSAKLLRSLDLDDDELLLGLYHGRPRTERSVEDSARLPDVIYIFQEDVELVAQFLERFHDEQLRCQLGRVWTLTRLRGAAAGPTAGARSPAATRRG